MQNQTGSTELTWQPEVSEREENDDTQPLRIISSRKPHSGIPAKPSGSWFKRPPGIRRTPDFTEIGDPAA